MVALTFFYVFQIASLPLQSFLTIFLPFLRLGRFLIWIIQIQLVGLQFLLLFRVLQLIWLPTLGSSL